MRSVAAIAVAIVIEASAGAAAAQQSVEYASVGGRVVDPSGAVVSGAQVVARQVDTNDAARRLTLTVGGAVDLQIALMLPEVTANVTVSAEGAPPTSAARGCFRRRPRIASITWKQEIKPGEVGEFVFFARNPAASQIVWKAQRRYADGQVEDWVGPAGDRRPAPSVSLTPR